MQTQFVESGNARLAIASEGLLQVNMCLSLHNPFCETPRLRRNLSHQLPDQPSSVGRDYGWASGDDLQWWDKQRANYELVVSQFVLDEAGAGDPVVAAKRMA